MSLIVKVSVENFETGEKMLHGVDKSKSLAENIQSVCEIFSTPSNLCSSCGLMIVTKNDGKGLFVHVSEDNFHEIKDGYFLKLVWSVQYYVEEIFREIRHNRIPDDKIEDLFRLSTDPSFIKELVKTGKDEVLIDHFTSNNLKNKELTACLIAITHLFQKGCIVEISSDFLNKVLSVVKNEPSDNKQLIYALSILQKVLLHRDPGFEEWKEKIIVELPITELTPYIWSEDFRDLQYGSLLLINTIIRCCKGEKRQLLIKEMNLKQNRDNIYKHIILSGKIDTNMAHELYVQQTYLLSLFSEAANSFININDTNIVRREEFELNENGGDIIRLTTLMDFDENVELKNKAASIENLLDFDSKTRISLASMSSMFSDDSRHSQKNSIMIEYDSSKISYLTFEALTHYKKHHEKNFCQSQIEEKYYQPGIFATSERIIRMLVKLLHVGREPDRSSVFYQPPVFNCSSKTPYLLELFSRTMWLLSRTRREMKVSTLNDYPKVMYILGKQIGMILEKKTLDFKSLTEEMLKTSYDVVMKQWRKDKDAEMNKILQENASVLELRERFLKDNEEIVFKQRMTNMFRGGNFPKIVDNKKIVGYFLAKLHENLRQLTIAEIVFETKALIGQEKIYNISDITHVVEGRACPHLIHNAVKDPLICFSIIINNADYINFTAKDNKMASYWIDGFNLLLGRENRSKFYKAELEDLVRMDLTLHLMELQNVRLPKKPPPIPPPPFDTSKFRPPIPPKPAFLL